ncbi:MAG: undecaprenyl-diphosphate phosphatase [Pseudobdellovibrionaceae bacterium]
MTFFQIFILSLIEGLTEFLPVSSTGHLILASAFMGIGDDQFIKSFNIIIQFGAILSVLVLYWRRFLPNLEFYKKLFIAFLPAAVIGLLVKSKIDLILGSVEIVAWALVVGGIILILTDRYFRDHPGNLRIDTLSWKDCLKLGFLQCFAFIPGVSRSGATIVGGLYLGMSRKEAAEFSFFLAVPTLAGATLIKTMGLIKTIDSSQISSLLAGMVLSYFFATIAIRFFLQIVSRFGFKHFGIYRIALGLVILFLIQRGAI